MSTANKLIKGSILRVLLTVCLLFVSFFMMPFIIKHLGDEWYGIWTIVGSLIGYYFLIDFGLAAAVARYCAKYVSKNDSYNSNVIINTSLLLYSYMSIVVLLFTAIICFFAPHFITLSTANIKVVRLVVIIVGLNLAIEFPFKAIAGITHAHLRFDLNIYIHFIKVILSVGFTYYFLTKGFGIIALSLITSFCSQISNILLFIVAKYLFRDLSIRRKYVCKEKIRKLFNYGIWSFLIQISDQIRFKIDAVVIGFFMPVSFVTHYFIGARLAEYFYDLSLKACNLMTPVFTRYHTGNNYNELRSKFLFLTKISSVMAVFGGGLIIALGDLFIFRWMGIDYMDAYPVLCCLVISLIFEIIYIPSTNALYAIAKHRYLAIVSLIESFFNVVLSLVLIHRYGIIGVALGTAIPLIISRFFILPIYSCRYIGIPKKTFYFAILPVIIISSGYLSAFYFLFKNTLFAPEYGKLLMAVIISIPFYIIIVFFSVFNKVERELLIKAIYSVLYIKKVKESVQS